MSGASWDWKKLRWILLGYIVGFLVAYGHYILFEGRWLWYLTDSSSSSSEISFYKMKKSLSLNQQKMSPTSSGHRPLVSNDAVFSLGEVKDRKVNVHKVVHVDQASFKAARATMFAHSSTSWMVDKENELYSNTTEKNAPEVSPPESVALAATIDHRPVTWRRQMRNFVPVNKEYQGEPIGCAFSTYVMVGQLGQINIKSFTRLQQDSHCALRFQFSNRRYAQSFAKNITDEAFQFGIHPDVRLDRHKSTVRVYGEARAIGSRNIDFQQAQKFQYQGFPWNIDCTFPNGVKSLTCESLTQSSDEMKVNDDLQFLSLETLFKLSKGKRVFDVSTSWPFPAVQTHNDNMHYIMKNISMIGSDPQSSFVPLNSDELSLAVVEGPVYHMEKIEGVASLVSTHLNESRGGVHIRLASNLIHQARQAPHSTRIIGVADGQVSATYDLIVKMLLTPLSELSPSCRTTLDELATQSPLGTTTSSEFICRSDFNATPSSSTLSDLLEKNGIQIRIVAFPLTTWAFEAMIIAGQYAFDVWIFARYASEYQAIMYFDGDAVPIVKNIKQSGRLQNIIYNLLFDPSKTMQCNAGRFHLVEQSIAPDRSSTDHELLCASRLLNNQDRWNDVLKACDFSYGNLVARTDAVLGLNVHYTMVDPADMPLGVSDCGWKDIFFFPPEEVIELHLTPKKRSFTCTCLD